MTVVDEWATRWGIPAEALRELAALISTGTATTADPSEAAVQSRVRLEAARAETLLFRNNSGAGTLENGSFVRWGLCNDSARLNAAVKSADLVGLRRIRITRYHVGLVIGQFVAREAKAATWRYTGDAREIAQLKFLTLINSYGGDAKFVTGPGSFDLTL